MADILTDIIANKRAEVARAQATVNVDALYRSALPHTVRSLSAALMASPTGIIAEFKRKSPSKGWIHPNAKPSEVVPQYEAAGATALSVLTDERFFGGRAADVHQARTARLPILRKDFTISEYQVHEARAMGADAVLLIAAALSPEDCRRLARTVHEVGLETLLEVHNAEELSYLNADIDVLGVNNRCLGTFVTDVAASVSLAPRLPKSLPCISESGLHDADTVLRLRRLGYRGFLMGEHFMRQAEPGHALHTFIDQLLNPAPEQ